MVDHDVFPQASPPKRSVTSTPDRWDLRLRPTSVAVDRGCVLPNVNDAYTGTAPDLGCHELESGLPHYGPRGSETESPEGHLTPQPVGYPTATPGVRGPEAC